MRFRNPLTPLIADLRAKRLLPVVALLLAALIAIPVLLSSPRSAPTVRTLPAVPGTGGTGPSAAVPAVRVTKRSTKPRAGGHGHDPFAQQVLPQSGSGISSRRSASNSAAASRGGSTSSRVSTRSTSTGSVTRSRIGSAATTTVAGKVTTPASEPPVPAPIYVHYAAKLSFGASRTPARVYSDPARFTTLPSLRRLALVFLGVGSDGRTTEFLVANHVFPAGQGHCTPSRTHCVYLHLKPGQAEVFFAKQSNGSVSESVLRYVSVTRYRVSATSPGAVRVSRDGRRVVSWVAQLLPALRRLRYGARTGLLDSPLAMPANHQGGSVVPVRLKRAPGWPG